MGTALSWLDFDFLRIFLILCKISFPIKKDHDDGLISLANALTRMMLVWLLLKKMMKWLSVIKILLRQKEAFFEYVSDQKRIESKHFFIDKT